MQCNILYFSGCCISVICVFECIRSNLFFRVSCAPYNTVYNSSNVQVMILYFMISYRHINEYTYIDVLHSVYRCTACCRSIVEMHLFVLILILIMLIYLYRFPAFCKLIHQLETGTITLCVVLQYAPQT